MYIHTFIRMYELKYSYIRMNILMEVKNSIKVGLIIFLMEVNRGRMNVSLDDVILSYTNSADAL